MKDQTRCRAPPEPDQPQRLHHQRPCQTLAHCKAEHLPIEQVDDDGEVKPALARGSLLNADRGARLDAYSHPEPEENEVSFLKLPLNRL